MKKINEIAELTGITKRALRYYDEIGLLIPSGISESEYRLYDDKALETLQQILFFKELDVPLKEIKSILEDPNFDRMSMLKKHKNLITRKRDRLNNILALIDKNLKGEKVMSFTEFELKSMRQAHKENIMTITNESFLEYVNSNFGGQEEFFDKVMKNLQNDPKIVYENFGNVQNYVKALKKESDPNALRKYKEKLNDICLSLVKNQDKDVSDKTIQRLVQDWQKLNEDFYNIDAFTNHMLNDMYKVLLKEIDSIKEDYKNTYGMDVPQDTEQKLMDECFKLAKVYDNKFGKGAAEFIGKALKYHCENK